MLKNLLYAGIPSTAAALYCIPSSYCRILCSIRNATGKEYITEPSLIQERLGHLADIVIDGGIGGTEGSTVVDCTTGDWEIVRQGIGELQEP